MPDEAPTKPTLETLSKQIEDLRAEMRAEIHAGFAAINYMFEQMDIRLDSIEGIALQARSEIMYLRVDFKAFRSQFKAPA
jgi:hypothetical protein